MFKSLLLTLMILIVTGCHSTSNRPQYYWGEYEQLIYDSYNKPGAATPALQIQKITRDIEKAKMHHQKIPPGLYAHLGMMYAAQGNKSLAIAAFNEEKKLFPESSILIDGMIQRSNRTNRQ